MRLLAISGSLRLGSRNTLLLKAAALVAPAGIDVEHYRGLGVLPHFNPDLEALGGPAEVDAFRASLKAADGVLICSPEYAHGVPGTLKNALDWVVGSGELVAKPVGLLNASPRAIHAQAALAEILTTMSARLVTEACIGVSMPMREASAREIAADAGIADALRGVLAAMTVAAGGG